MDIEGEQHIKENATMYPESWNRLLQYVMCKIAKEADDHLNLKLLCGAPISMFSQFSIRDRTEPFRDFH
jgi:hypothetical protein